MDPQCTVQELKQRIDAGDPPLLIDVREDAELEICKLPDCVHFRLNEIPERIAEFDQYADREVVIYCHHGMRSEMARQYLAQHGHANFRNLAGGIHLWALEIDPEMAVY